MFILYLRSLINSPYKPSKSFFFHVYIRVGMETYIFKKEKNIVQHGLYNFTDHDVNIYLLHSRLIFQFPNMGTGSYMVLYLSVVNL